MATRKPKAQKRRRKVIQIATVPWGRNEQDTNPAAFYALCDDGTLWFHESHRWFAVHDIPQLYRSR